MKIHIVKQGDTLYQIGLKYGVTVEEIMKLNPIIHDPDDLVVGLKVKIPSTPTQIKLPKEEKAEHPFKQETIEAQKVGSFYNMPELSEMEQTSWNHTLHSGQQLPQYPADAYKPYELPAYPSSGQYIAPTFPQPYYVPHHVPEIKWNYPGEATPDDGDETDDEDELFQQLFEIKGKNRTAKPNTKRKASKTSGSQVSKAARTAAKKKKNKPWIKS